MSSRWRCVFISLPIAADGLSSCRVTGRTRCSTLLQSRKSPRLPAWLTVFIGLLAHEKFKATDFSSLRTAYSGSAPLPEETMRQWSAQTGTPILEGFGQTQPGPC